MDVCDDEPDYTGLRRGAGGSATGTFRTIRSPADAKALSEGEVAFLPSDTHHSNDIPLFYSLVRNGASAILCEHIGKTDHGVLLTNELSVPCISDISPDIEAWEGETITVDGANVFAGVRDTRHETPSIDPDTMPSTDHQRKLNLGFPEVVTEHPEFVRATDGIGFMRLEFVMLDVLDGLHPEEYVDRHTEAELADRIADRIEPALDECDGKPVWIRTNDFAASQLRHMEGGTEYEDPESNSMMGWRGIARAVDDSSLFDVEIQVFERLLDAGHRNIGIFPPMTRFQREYVQWKRRLVDAGLDQLSFGLMVETPSAALTFEEFIDHIDFMIFGSNDLTQFTLAIDRDNEKLRLKYDETELAVERLMIRVLDICNANDIESSIGGQAASHPKLLQRLLDHGISGVSINPDAETITKTSNCIREWECNREARVGQNSQTR